MKEEYPKKKDQWFSHSGDLGDIIYSLPTIRAAGGGTLYLFNAKNKTTHQMTRARMELIRPLIALQPYIEGVEFWDENEAKDHNLNGFRNHGGNGVVIADKHLRTHGFSQLERNKKWLIVDTVVEEYPVVFHRSSRYHNGSFPWKRIWEKYRQQAVFVGLPEEHKAFCQGVGPVPHVPTKDYLELARIIAGCRLYVGNQSSPYAVAEGLKQTAILEVCPWANDCCYPRLNVIHGWDGSADLPDIDAGPVTLPAPETLAVPKDAVFKSQFGEDRWLATHVPLPEKGTFVEVGAFDGINCSNSYHFERRGWTGLCVEASPDSFASLVKNRSCKTEWCACGRENKDVVTFYVNDNPHLSGLMNRGSRKIDVPQRTLGDLVQKHGISHIDVLSIDVEGTELDVWRSLDRSKCEVDVVVIEWNTQGLKDAEGLIRRELEPQGYRCVHKTQGNLIFVRNGME
jgi:FkbM family methyltransferase